MKIEQNRYVISEPWTELQYHHHVEVLELQQISIFLIPVHDQDD